MMETIREWALVYLILDFILIGVLMWFKWRYYPDEYWRTDWNSLAPRDIIETKMNGYTSKNTEVYRVVEVQSWSKFIQIDNSRSVQKLLKTNHTFKKINR